MKYDVAVIGASLGGVQAAISAARENKKVYLCEQTDWIGGQLSSQAVPPDEHRWIEEFGGTQRYLQYRRDVRDHYRQIPELKKEVAEQEYLNPGNAWVSRIPHEPKVAVEILNGYLKEYIEQGTVVVDYFTTAISAEVKNDVIQSVTVKNLQNGEEKYIEAAYFLDATDCGDLLPIVGAEYRTGAESKAETAEPHAPEAANPYDMQPITWVAALELNPDGEDYRIEKPEEYEYFSSLDVPYDDNKLISWWYCNCATGKKVKLAMFDNEAEFRPLGMWNYRRIIDTANYTDERKEVMLFNWPQNDYSDGNVYEDPDAAYHLERSRIQTMCALYWLQNEAERPDGGKGYRVKLRPDIMGTEDGLAKAPYIRESRRIVAKRTVCEQDVAVFTNETPQVFEDSVGVGSYAMDLHMTTKTGTNLFEAAHPYEIPLASMIPVRMKNLIPSCKNIGCTHITQGCYRLHPTEWNIGEVAGYMAAYCLEHNISLEQLLEDHVKDFQSYIMDRGVQIHWDFSKMDYIGRA